MSAATVLRAAFVLAAGLTGVAAQAQTIYRCGPDGRSYSQQPCAQGQLVDVRDERSAQQREQGQAVADSQRALGDRLEQERLQHEAHPGPAASHIGTRSDSAKVAQAVPTAAARKKRTSRKASQQDAPFTAMAPAGRKP